LTDVQKSRIESTFEAHRQNLVSRKEQLEKEEAQLGRLLDAESIDRGSIFTQINRVVQARGEMERENAAMTLEMRELLTRAQWTQLQTASPVRWEVAPALGGLGIATPPAAGARGARGGARSGNPPQQ
jgi:Spy/CpxP family protein refolding chaperone